MIRVSKNVKPSNRSSSTTEEEANHQTTDGAKPEAAITLSTSITKPETASIISIAIPIAFMGGIPLNSVCQKETINLQHETLNIQERNTIPNKSIQTQSKQVEVVKSTNPVSMIKKLKWSDFEGTVPPATGWLATTMWNYSYTYKKVATNDPNMVKVRLQVGIKLSPKSWVRSPSDILLNHEQGHYDIACLCMLNFKKRVIEKEFGRLTVRDEVVEIYHDVLQEFREKQIQYDEDTNHYFNVKEQARWDKQICEDLKALSMYEFMNIAQK